MNNTIKKYADENDIEGLKFAFKDMLDVDPSFNEFLEEYNYVLKNGLFEPHRSLSGLNNDKSVWDKSYWIRIKRDLLENFSKERIDHMREVAKVIYADKLRRAKESEQQEVKATPPAPKVEPTEAKEKPSAKTASTGIPRETKAEYEARIAKELEEERKKYSAPPTSKHTVEATGEKKKTIRFRTSRSTAASGFAPMLVAIAAAIAVILAIILLLR